MTKKEYELWFDEYKLKGYGYDINYLGQTHELPNIEITIKFCNKIIHSQSYYRMGDYKWVNIIKNVCITHQRDKKIKELGI